MTEITIHDEQPKENQAPMGDMTGSKRRVKKTYDGVTVEAYSYETQIEELKRAERINRVFFRISNAVSVTSDLNQLYASIHQTLDQVIDGTNFFYCPLR